MDNILKVLASEYKTAAAMEQEARRAKEQAAAQLKTLLADCEQIFVGEYRIDYKTVKKTCFDTKALQHDIPELYTKYCYIQETRPLYVR